MKILLVLLLLYSRRINISLKPDKKFTDYTGGIAHSFRFLAGTRVFSAFHNVQTSRGSPKPNYPVGTGVCFPEDKTLVLKYG
jgi:hypothetical protein